LFGESLKSEGYLIFLADFKKRRRSFFVDVNDDSAITTIALSRYLEDENAFSSLLFLNLSLRLALAP